MTNSGLRWFMIVAKISAVLGIAVLLVFFIGEGLFGDDPWPPEFTLSEGVLFAFFPIGVGLGLVLGLLWPRLGGAMAVLSLIAFYVAFLIDRGELPRGPFFILFTIGGPLLLIAGWLQARSGGRSAMT